ncbi:hypothetical protein jhhlp_007265 [Lomentospora prolificans]|uniref:PUM-HD domain-containing protein n=1 Tax=Lomentospora prolificans TaxID=41688 RepID=A0A2N3N267_9PEZI|nr:hypothetical protein jhhlp_007265 [Lomentospora prolificans]
MGVKSTAAGAKRKASGGRAGPAGSPKKARIQEDRMDLDSDVSDPDSDSASDSDMDSSSDSEDGGVKLNGSGPKFGRAASVKKGEQAGKKKADAAKPSEKSSKTSREVHAEQKQLAKERKAAKPLADELQRTKKIWERLRRKSHVPAEERKKLIEELYTIITGRMKDFVLKHDAVRAVQTAVKYSTVEQRKMIAKELQGAYSQLAESRYAKFLIGKLMVQSDAEVKDMIISEFYGRVKRLINHPEASWIVDDIYRAAASKDQKAMLLREWYGPEFAIMERTGTGPPTGDLSKILEEHPAKRGPIMKYLWDMINSLVQKKMTGFTMLHDAMFQYFRNVTPGSNDYNEFFELVKGDEEGDLLKNMAFTKNGAHLVCLLFANGTAKDRKQLLKSYKDTLLMMSGDPYAHLVILTAYDVIDDTKMTSKAIFSELFGETDEQAAESMMAAASNSNARATILYLFEGPAKSVFPGLLQEDLEILNEVHEIRKTTSKKDADVRTKELVAAMSPQLLAGVRAAAETLVHDSFGCQLLAEIMFCAVGDKTAALESIAANAAGNPEDTTTNIEDTAAGSRPHISQTPHGGRLLKSLIAGGKYDKASGTVKKVDPPLNFANILYPVIKDHIVSWATGPSSFVVLNMLEAEDFGDKKKLRSTLQKSTAALEKAAGGNDEPKKKADKKGENGKKKGGPAPKAGGNQGSKLLLEKLR